MIVNTDDDQLFENLSIIIDEFEKAALLSGTREGAMVVANSPLTAMDNMLLGSDEVLGRVQDSRQVSDEETSNAETDEGINVKEFFSGQGDAISLLEFDQDLTELFGGKNNPTKNYLEECLNCDLRLKFDWQLKPINLLGGIQGLLDGINEILDAFQIQLNPDKLLADICNLLNLLKGLCLPDLISIILALKMLLKRYISEAISIRLDWTVVLGPLLKLIIEGIVSLLENIGAVILAPICCALNALTVANDLEREARELAGQIGSFASESVGEAGAIASAVASGQLPPGTDIDGLAEDYSWGGSTVGETAFPEAPQFGQLSATTKETDPAALFNFNLGGVNGGGSSGGLGGGTGGGAGAGGAGFGIPVGFDFTKEPSLEDALKDPTFADTTLTQKLLIPVRDAKNYIQDLLDRLIHALRSVQVLVSGGISVQMGNIGIIMFITDMINLIMMIIGLLQTNLDVKDWCTHLEKNPELLEEAIRSRFGPTLGDIRVESNKAKRGLLLKKGPDIIGEIKTCADHRTAPETQILNQWIQDLKRQGTD